MAKKAKTKDVAKKTIEQTLWDSANELRGNLDAAEYKSVVLGLVFLKCLLYICCGKAGNIKLLILNMQI